MTKGYTYIWEYTIDPACESEFLAAYGPEGEWVQLFRRFGGYLRTELLRDVDDPARFVTIDHWESREAWQAFRNSATDAFRELDQRCEGYTERERDVGSFVPGSG